MKHLFYISVLILGIQINYAQEKKSNLDSIQKIKEVVITGQYSKQSIKKSAFEVKVINAAMIEQHAANNLADLLNQTLNIQITPNAQEGKSTVSLFGLDGQYFKILENGIPLVSEDGFGNNIDLTQINLDDVKQIEIVEGSMGVSYGANAVSGVINIITKKSSKYNWKINTSIQEESAGNEFSFWDKGRHIQKLHLAHNINSHLYTSFNIHRDHFTGYEGTRKGKNYFQQDHLRGYEWFPKEQLSGNGLLNYKKNQFNLSYKVGLFKALLKRYDSNVVDRNNTETGLVDILAPDDKDFLTHRMSHNLIVNTKIKHQVNVNFYAAYQEQIKKVRRVIYDLHTRTAANEAYKNYLYRKTYFSKATFNHFFKDKPYDFEFGVTYNLEDGFGASVASIINTVDVNEKMYHLDAFASMEYHLNDNLLVKPGVRYSLQSKFKNQFQYSLSSRYLFKHDFTLRTVVGSSYRTPNFDELYTYFVDGNHNVTGNEALVPERSLSINTYLKKAMDFNSVKWLSKIKIGYLNVKDRIDLAIVSTQPALAYKYINVDKHRSVDFSFENKLQYKKLKFNLNATLLGISQTQNTNTTAVNEDYLYTLLFNANVNYFIQKLHSRFVLNYKYNGAQSEYIYNTVGDIVKNTLNPYSWVDASFKTAFLHHKIETVIGARNLFNVVRVSSSYSNHSSTHNTNSGNRLLGYGRSYFIKLKYKLNI